MNQQQRNALRRFRSGQEYLTANQVAGTGPQLSVLSGVIRQLAETGTEQDESTRQTRGEVRRQRALRRAVWVHHVKPISRIARRTLGTPGLEAKFVLPSNRVDNEAFIQAATAMAQAAEQHAAAFVAQGLPADFVQQLRSATTTLATAVGKRVQVNQRREKAIETAVELVKRGRASVDVLDVIVSSRLESQPELLAAWKTAKRLTGLGGGGAAPAGPDAPDLKVA